MDDIEGFDKSQDFLENGVMGGLDGQSTICGVQDTLCEAQDLLCEGHDAVCKGHENGLKTSVQKKYFRDFDNPFERLSEEEFKVQYRLSKNAVLHGVLPKVCDFLAKPNRRGLPIDPVFQLLITLRFYATANFQVRVM